MRSHAAAGDVRRLHDQVRGDIASWRTDALALLACLHMEACVGTHC
jgi:hypothetical protein